MCGEKETRGMWRIPGIGNANWEMPVETKHRQRFTALNWSFTLNLLPPPPHTHTLRSHPKSFILLSPQIFHFPWNFSPLLTIFTFPSPNSETSLTPTCKPRLTPCLCHSEAHTFLCDLIWSAYHYWQDLPHFNINFGLIDRQILRKIDMHCLCVQ